MWIFYIIWPDWILPKENYPYFKTTNKRELHKEKYTLAFLNPPSVTLCLNLRWLVMLWVSFQKIQCLPKFCSINSQKNYANKERHVIYASFPTMKFRYEWCCEFSQQHADTLNQRGRQERINGDRLHVALYLKILKPHFQVLKKSEKNILDVDNVVFYKRVKSQLETFFFAAQK